MNLTKKLAVCEDMSKSEGNVNVEGETTHKYNGKGPITQPEHWVWDHRWKDMESGQVWNGYPNYLALCVEPKLPEVFRQEWGRSKDKCTWETSEKITSWVRDRYDRAKWWKVTMKRITFNFDTRTTDADWNWWGPYKLGDHWSNDDEKWVTPANDADDHSKSGEGGKST